MENKGSSDGSSKMSGWQIQKYGELDQLKFSEDIPKPKIAKPTQVLIEVLTTSVNQLDVFMIGIYSQKHFKSLFFIEIR